MRYENIKSAILIFLVLFSIVLTWNLWTYQPDFKTIDNKNYVEQVSISEQKELKKIVKPDTIYFHVNGKHFGTENSLEIDRLVREIGRWVVSDVKNNSEKAGSIKDLSEKGRAVEIAFPAKVPVEIYRNILNIDQKKIPPFNFDRIVVNMDSTNKENGSVYFVSSETQQVYSAQIPLSFLNDFNKNFFKNATNYPAYFAFKPTDRRTIYLPEKETNMLVYKYLPAKLDSELFKEALFRDPSFVRKSVIDGGEEYTNDSSKMNIDDSTNILTYVNPTENNTYVGNSYDLLNKSIDFVNGHGGWTDSYRYVSMDELNQKVTFRLYSTEGYPVFNERGMSEVTEVWGRDEINKYIRPSIALDFAIQSEMATVSLPSGHQVLEYLQTKKNFKISHLEDIVLGYQMQKDLKSEQLITLEPTWFYQYNGSWGQVTSEDLGGLKHGLE